MKQADIKFKGWVHKYLDAKSFGFIAIPNKDKLDDNVFFHITDVIGGNIKVDDNVEFKLVRTDKGLKAIDVKVIDDGDIVERQNH